MKHYIDYKPSSVDWLPEIPAHWQIKRLKNICRLQGRVGFKGYQTSDMVEPGQGALTIGGKHIRHNVVDVSDPDYISWEKYYESPEIMIETGDIMVAQRGTLGKVAHLTEEIGPATINPSLIVLKDITISSRFLYWYLRSNYLLKVVDMLNTSTAVPMLSQFQFSEFRVITPPDTEQRTIARFLDDKTAQVDKLITQKQQMLTLLQEERAALINHAVTKGLDAAVAVRDSGIVWIPDLPVHWDRIKIKALVSTKITDGPHETPEFLVEGISFLSAESIKENKLDFSAKRGYISAEQHQIYTQKSSVKKNDILFCKSGSTTGKSALVETDEDFGIWSPLAIIRARADIIDYKYLFLCIQSYTFRNQVENFWSFGTQPNIGMGTLENLWVSVPPIAEQQSIILHVEEHTLRIKEAMAVEEKSISLLQEYRAAIIAEAVTGQIDVRNYEPALSLTAEFVG